MSPTFRLILTLNLLILSTLSLIKNYLGGRFNKFGLGSVRKLARVQNSRLRYGIIVDAGSTQTRLFIYQWEGPTNASYSAHVQPMIELRSGRQAHYVKDGGIAELPPSHLPMFFLDLIDYAKRQLPTSKHASVPIYVKATAGVRILSEAKRVAVVKALTDYLSDPTRSPFLFDPNLGVQVLSGEFEGAFDWLTVNYLAGTLGKEAVERSQISIDMGGSSLELTFEPSGELMEGAFPLRFNGTDIILYTHSYLKFGRNQALLRHRQALLEAFSDDVIRDPCFQVGFGEAMELDDRIIEIVGTGDYERCLMLTRKLLRESKFCPSEPCAMNGVYQPDLPPDRPIVAIDSFAKLAELLGCPKVSNLECLEVKANLTCQASARFTERREHKGLHAMKCFLAAYGTNVLRRGFRVDPHHPILFTDQACDGTSTGWTIGAMIYELELRSFNNGDCGVPDGA